MPGPLNCFYICMYICMLVHVHIFMVCECRCMHITLCMLRLKDKLRCQFLPSTLFETESLFFYCVCQASCPLSFWRFFPLLFVSFWSSGITGAYVQLLCEFWGFKFRPSVLYLSNQTILSPQPLNRFLLPPQNIKLVVLRCLSLVSFLPPFNRKLCMWFVNFLSHYLHTFYW